MLIILIAVAITLFTDYCPTIINVMNLDFVDYHLWLCVLELCT